MLREFVIRKVFVRDIIIGVDEEPQGLVSFREFVIREVVVREFFIRISVVRILS